MIKRSLDLLYNIDIFLGSASLTTSAVFYCPWLLYTKVLEFGVRKESRIAFILLSAATFVRQVSQFTFFSPFSYFFLFHLYFLIILIF